MHSRAENDNACSNRFERSLFYHESKVFRKNKTLDLRTTKEVLLDCQSVCQPPMSTDALFCAPQKQLIQTEHEKLLSQLG